MAMALGGVAAVGAAGAAAAATSSAVSIGTILSGIATVAGVVATIAAANAEAETQDLAAIDADREQPLETLQGIDRRRSLKAAVAAALGDQDVAYAASGVDSSFGTAAQARKAALQEADMGLTADAGTQMTRQSRLSERAGNYRTMAKRTRQIGIIKGVAQGIGGLAGLVG